MSARCALASCTPMTAESSHRYRWHSHRQDQRNGIIHAAGNVFAEVGYDRANMRMVAERAGVAKPTLYAYFRGESALLEAVIEYWLDAVPPPTLEHMQGKTLRLQLNHAARELLHQARHPASIAFDQMVARSSLVRTIYLERWHQRFRRCARVGPSRRRVRPARGSTALQRRRELATLDGAGRVS